MKRNLLQLLLVLAIGLKAAFAEEPQRKMVDFTGGARSVVANNGLSVSDSIPDSTTVDHTTTGYALVDLGVNIRPNQTTELMGMFRIRSDYGGFWGAGVTFDVRQLWLKGVIGNIVRYQVGDLNLKQTPFTLYNHHADRFSALPDVFSLQSDIVDYERFFIGNTWRQQGVNVDFGLVFAKGIQGIDFSGYLTRMNATNFFTVPDRLMAGFSATVVQQENLKVGYHHAEMFDVQGTAAEVDTFNNRVQSITAFYRKDINTVAFTLDGEGGTSHYIDTRYPGRASLNDYFLYARLKADLKDRDLSVHLGYLNVGPDFRSYGAQSKDIDYSALPQDFNRYTNAQTTRPLDLADMIGNNNIYVTSVSDKLMGFNPAVNNVLPYGLATFNRLGVFSGIEYRGIKGLGFDATYYALREIRGQGTLSLKKFTRADLNARVEIGELLEWKKKITFHSSVSNQTTSRTGNVSLEDVSLQTIRLQTGIEIELTKGLDLLGGAVFLNSTGSDFVAERDGYTEIDFFELTDFELSQDILAAGLRYRFDKNVYLAGLYQSSTYDDRSGKNAGYTIGQFAIIFNMTF